MFIWQLKARHLKGNGQLPLDSYSNVSKNIWIPQWSIFLSILLNILIFLGPEQMLRLGLVTSIRRLPVCVSREYPITRSFVKASTTRHLNTSATTYPRDYNFSLLNLLGQLPTPSLRSIHHWPHFQYQQQHFSLISHPNYQRNPLPYDLT